MSFQIFRQSPLPRIFALSFALSVAGLVSFAYLTFQEPIPTLAEYVPIHATSTVSPVVPPFSVHGSLPLTLAGVSIASSVPAEGAVAGNTRVFLAKMNATGGSVVLSWSGFAPNTEYHLYVDDHRPEHHSAVTSDASGTITATVDLTAAHLVLLQAHHSTSFIDDTGGDCTGVSGPPTGTWDNDTKTCTLTSDALTDAQEIDIVADGITLNCDGHSLLTNIAGNSGGSFGIASTGNSNVTIENCTVGGNVFNIFVSGGTGNRVIGNHVNDNGDGSPQGGSSIIVTSDDFTVQDNVATALHASYGISTEGAGTIDGNTATSCGGGMSVQGVTGKTITISDNILNGNDGAGLIYQTGGTVTISGNQTNGNNEGMDIDNVDDTTLTDNVSNGNVHNGMFLGQHGGSKNFTLTGNTTNGNDVGVYHASSGLLGTKQFVMDGHTANDNVNYGMYSEETNPDDFIIRNSHFEGDAGYAAAYLFFGPDPTPSGTRLIDSNTFLDNTNIGIYADLSSNQADPTGLVISGNVITGGGLAQDASGLLVGEHLSSSASFSSGDQITGNVISHSGGVGMWIEGPWWTVEGNTVTGNATDGMYFTAGSSNKNVVEGNTISGNGGKGIHVQEGVTIPEETCDGPLECSDQDLGCDTAGCQDNSCISNCTPAPEHELSFPASENQFSDNIVIDNESGILLTAAHTDNTLTGNTFCANTLVDAQDDDTNTWTANTCDTHVGNAACVRPCESNGPPAPVVTPTVTVISPNGGETLAVGMRVHLFWITVGLAGEVNLAYSVDSGATWTDIARGITNEDQYVWTVPDATSAHARIRVEASDGVTVFATDGSDADFTLAGTAGGILPPAAGSSPSLRLRCAPSGSAGDDAAATGIPQGQPGSRTNPFNALFPGRYMRTVDDSTVWYISFDRKRHALLDARTYFTREVSFGSVVYVMPEAIYGAEQGSPVLPAPNMVLLTFRGDDDVYALAEDPADPSQPLLRRLDSEAVALSIYGPRWADYVLDMNPAFLALFEIGKPVIDSEPLRSDLLYTRDELTACVGGIKIENAAARPSASKESLVRMILDRILRKK